MKLKTCPFCGGKPYLEEAQRGFVNGESTKVCYVRCTECGARSGRYDLKDFGCTSSSSEAIKLATTAWNNRTWFESEVNVLTKSEKSMLKKKCEEASA